MVMLGDSAMFNLLAHKSQKLCSTNVHMHMHIFSFKLTPRLVYKGYRVPYNSTYPT